MNGSGRRRASCSSGVVEGPTPNIGPPPRSRADAVYDVRRWTVADRGLHFPAMENPDLYVNELRTLFRPSALTATGPSGAAPSRWI